MGSDYNTVMYEASTQISVDEMKWRVALAHSRTLREHEEISEKRLMELAKILVEDGVLKQPLLVDVSNRIILDGHHRYRALMLMGAKLIPVFLVDYSSPKVTVGSWRPGYRVTKEIVLKAGLTGRKLPPKTSRHVLVGIKIPTVNYPIEKLVKGDNLGYWLF